MPAKTRAAQPERLALFMDFSWLTKLIPSLKDLSNYFLPLALTCTAILFLPEQFIEPLGLIMLRKQGQPYLGVAFVFSKWGQASLVDLSLEGLPSPLLHGPPKLLVFNPATPPDPLFCVV